MEHQSYISWSKTIKYFWSFPCGLFTGLWLVSSYQFCWARCSEQSSWSFSLSRQFSIPCYLINVRNSEVRCLPNCSSQKERERGVVRERKLFISCRYTRIVHFSSSPCNPFNKRRKDGLQTECSLKHKSQSWEQKEHRKGSKNPFTLWLEITAKIGLVDPTFPLSSWSMWGWGFMFVPGGKGMACARSGEGVDLRDREWVRRGKEDRNDCVFRDDVILDCEATKHWKDDREGV